MSICVWWLNSCFATVFFLSLSLANFRQRFFMRTEFNNVGIRFELRLLRHNELNTILFILFIFCHRDLVSALCTCIRLYIVYTFNYTKQKFSVRKQPRCVSVNTYRWLCWQILRTNAFHQRYLYFVASNTKSYTHLHVIFVMNVKDDYLVSEKSHLKRWHDISSTEM